LTWLVVPWAISQVSEAFGSGNVSRTIDNSEKLRRNVDAVAEPNASQKVELKSRCPFGGVRVRIPLRVFSLEEVKRVGPVQTRLAAYRPVGPEGE
jgi:hypothetical protein